MPQIDTKPTLIIANRFHEETIEQLDRVFDTHKLWLMNPGEQSRLIEDLSESCSAVATASWETNPLIYRLPNLQIISCFGVGVDGIDFEITRANGITVTNTPDVLNDAVADIAIALILATQRNLINADGYVRTGQWRDAPFPLGRSLAGQTLGIIGLGSIGEDIATRAASFKMDISYHNRHPKNLPYKYYSDLNELASDADILLCMLPGGAATMDLVDHKVFNSLGPEGTFINVGRGTSVNEVHLVEALQSGAIAAAGLDVYKNEPRINEALLNLENVVLLPHIGSATVETRTAMGNLVIENLLAWRDGMQLKTPVP